MDGKNGALVFGEAANSRCRQCEKILHLAAAEGLAFRGCLDFDKLSAAGHNHVHVHFSA